MKTPRRPVFLDLNTLESLTPTEDLISWSIVADETAEILIGKRNVEPFVRHGVIQLIINGDLEDVATLWANSPNTCLAGMMWRSYMMYQWLLYDPTTLKKHYDKGMNAPVENTLEITFESVTWLLENLMTGKFEESGLTVYEYYADMAAFLRILAAGVAFSDLQEDDVIFSVSPASDMLVLKSKSLLVLAKEFEDASCAIDTVNKSHSD